MRKNFFVKNIITTIFIFILIFYSTNVSAEIVKETKPDVNIQVKGNIETGQDIQILINVYNIKNLYAGAVKFKYDKSILKVTDIQKGDLINKKDINIFEVGNEIDNDKGVARFKGFSCLGQVDGFSGSGTFIIINAKILKKADFHLKSRPLLEEPNDENNLKIQMVDKNLEDMDYNFKGYNFKAAAPASPNSKVPVSSKAENKAISVKNPQNNTEDESSIVKHSNEASNKVSKNSDRSETKTIIKDKNEANDNNVDKDIKDNKDNNVKSKNTSSNTVSTENLYEEKINNLNKNSSLKNVAASKNNSSLDKIKYLIIVVFIIILLIIGIKIYKFRLKNKS